MAFIPTATDCWRIALTYTSFGGNNAANVIYAQDEGDYGNSLRAEQVADIVRGWAISDWADIANTNWTMTRVDVAQATTQTGTSFAELTPTPGAVAQPPMPSQDTIAVRLSTGFMGRSNRGRLYHVGLSEADISDGLVNGTFRAAAVTAYEALLSALAFDDLLWSVVSFRLNNAPRTAGVARPVTSIGFADDKVDRQIRRKK